MRFTFRPTDLDVLQEKVADDIFNCTEVQGVNFNTILNERQEAMEDAGMSHTDAITWFVTTINDDKKLRKVIDEYVDEAVQKFKIDLSRYDYDRQYDLYEYMMDDFEQGRNED